MDPTDKTGFFELLFFHDFKITIISCYSADPGLDHIPRHTQGIILMAILMMFIGANQRLQKLNSSLNLGDLAKARNRG